MICEKYMYMYNWNNYWQAWTRREIYAVENNKQTSMCQCVYWAKSNSSNCYFSSKQLLLFVFARQYNTVYCHISCGNAPLMAAGVPVTALVSTPNPLPAKLSYFNF